MELRELADLRYAAALRPHDGGLGADEEYDSSISTRSRSRT